MQHSQENTRTAVLFWKSFRLSPATLSKKKFWHWYFSVSFAKFLGTPFSQNTLGDCSCRCSGKFCHSHRRTPWSPFFVWPTVFPKKPPLQDFSCVFLRHFQNIYFTEHLCFFLLLSKIILNYSQSQSPIGV